MKRLLKSSIFLLIVLAVWEVTLRVANIPQYLVPKPYDILSFFRIEWFELLKHAMVTSAESFLGLLLGTVIGLLVAILSCESRFVEDVILPYFVALKSVPIVALAPLLVIWFGSGFTGKIVMSALICFFPIVVNMLEGLKSPTREHLDLFESMNASRWQALRYLRIPNATPYLFAALRIASTLSVVGAIVAEFSGASRGIGYLMMVYLYQLEVPGLCCGIVISGLIGYAFYCLIELSGFVVGVQTKT